MLFALWSFGVGRGHSRRRRRSSPGLLLPLRGSFFAERFCLRVGHVAELLHAARIDLRGKDAVALVDRNANDALELPRQQAVSPERDAQLPLGGEDLDAVLHTIGNPYVAVTIDRDALRPRKISRPVAV